MKKGQRVSFFWDVSTASGGVEAVTAVKGTGEVITDEQDGHVLVSQDPVPPEARHQVIRCAVTWLTEIPTAPLLTPTAPLLTPEPPTKP